MTQWMLFATGAIILFVIGLVGAVSGRVPLRQVMSLNVMGSGVFLFFLSIAQRNAQERPDPVPHAMVLTGIVVALSATAFAVSLIQKLARTEDGKAENASSANET